MITLLLDISSTMIECAKLLMSSTPNKEKLEAIIIKIDTMETSLISDLANVRLRLIDKYLHLTEEGGIHGYTLKGLQQAGKQYPERDQFEER